MFPKAAFSCPRFDRCTSLLFDQSYSLRKNMMTSPDALLPLSISDEQVTSNQITTGTSQSKSTSIIYFLSQNTDFKLQPLDTSRVVAFEELYLFAKPSDFSWRILFRIWLQRTAERGSLSLFREARGYRVKGGLHFPSFEKERKLCIFI
jgi:hypothetical protein